MEQLFEQDQIILPSMADAGGRLGIPNTFGLFMDIASIHAGMLGSGMDDMARRGLFWLTVKTQIIFFDRPRVMERICARTWPESPGKIRCNRSYQLLRGEDVLVAGKTEWAVIDLKTKQLAPLTDVYPPALSFELPSASDLPFARIQDGGDGWQSFSEYRVRSTDIDIGGHMNNAAYVRAILGAFSTEQRKSLHIGRMDVIFRSPCFEGETLTLERREIESGLDLRFVKDSGTALLARIESK